MHADDPDSKSHAILRLEILYLMKSGKKRKTRRKSMTPFRSSEINQGRDFFLSFREQKLQEQRAKNVSGNLEKVLDFFFFFSGHQSTPKFVESGRKEKYPGNALKSNQ